MRLAKFGTDAYRRCRLGQWYYGRHSPAIGNDPGFVALGEVHQTMHDCARKLTRSAQKGKAIPESVYERFMDTVLALSEHIRKLQYGILSVLAHSDPLTGICNRLTSQSILEEERARFERTQQPCCVVLVDLDHFGEKEIFVTASFGIAYFTIGLSSEEVIDRADRALYQAKRAGRNQVRIWSPEGG
jgi:GGDEF domain-containing protein